MTSRNTQKYDQLAIPKDQKGIERIDRLVRLLEKEKGVQPIQRYAAVLLAVDEAIDRRAKRKVESQP